MPLNIRDKVVILPTVNDEDGSIEEDSLANRYVGTVGSITNISINDATGDPLYFVTPEGEGKAIQYGFYGVELKKVDSWPGNLTFAEYMVKACETVIYPDAGDNLLYPALKLCGEAGEVAEKVGKLHRDLAYRIGEGGWVLTNDVVTELMKEVGDVLWYCAALAMELGTTIEDIAQANINKLESRKERGTLQGNGDNR